MRIRSFKRFAIGFVAVLLLAIGYFWMQYNQPVSLSPVADVKSDSAGNLNSLSAAQDSSGIDTVSIANELTQKKQPVNKVAVRPVEQEPATNQLANSPAGSEQKTAPAEVVDKPVPVACDQLVMRNGDLIDAEVSEVGVNEIRYKRCHQEDGPVYVVSKSEVLSIRFANGDIDRF